MKKAGFSILIVFYAMMVNAQWTWQNPLPQGNSLSSIYFVDQYIGYSGGVSGTLLKSVDGGASWNILKSGKKCI